MMYRTRLIGPSGTAMDEGEFDRFADEYRALHARNIRLSGEAPEYFAEYKVKDMAEALAKDRAGGNPNPDILDFGAGVGTSLPYLRKYFPTGKVTCLDVSRKSLAVAAERFPGLASFVPFDGRSIPFADASFDIALAACVFHHIDHEEHAHLLAEIRRVLRPTGTLFVFEHNPLNPLTCHAVRTCEFDENARLIVGPAMKRRLAAAGLARPRLRYRLFFPHALASLRRLEPYMTALPLGAQYYVMAEKP
jgi:SAM-dependent methyltransferase